MGVRIINEKFAYNYVPDCLFNYDLPAERSSMNISLIMRDDRSKSRDLTQSAAISSEI